jgi:formyl-CoA transferase
LATHRSQEPLIAEVTAFMPLRTTEDWLGRFAAASLMAGKINTLAEAAQVVARGITVPTLHAAGGFLPLVGNPIVFAETPIASFHSPPLLNEHTNAMLTELGLDGGEIAALCATGAIGEVFHPRQGHAK